ncbi:hypothetical protein HDV01_004420 [Terramyces sp. JEL0728]|nr:hypothetical protein HDV01_004420 [Terramyces sp. JEL0728]
MSLPVVGATISLISKSNIRFVGILFNINHEESSISLQNVRSFGTEGRAKRPEDEIPAQPNTFPLIVFKGSDVKDLKVEDNKAPAMQHMAYMQQMYWQQQQPGYQYPNNQFGMGFNEPINPSGFAKNMPGFANGAPGFANPQSGFPSNGFNQPPKAEIQKAAKPKDVDELANKLDDVKVTPNVTVAKKKATASALQVNKPGDVEVKVEKQKEKQPRKETKTVLNFSELEGEESEETCTYSANLASKKKPQPKTAWQNKPQQNGRSGQTNRTQNSNERKQKNRQSKQPEEGEEAKAEQTENHRQEKKPNKKPGKKLNIPTEEFDFESSNAKFEKTDLDSPFAEKTYNKSSFFDDISCEMKDKLEVEQVDVRAKRQEEKSLNMETFGQTGVRYNWRGRGRGRVAQEL